MLGFISTPKAALCDACHRPDIVQQAKARAAHIVTVGVFVNESPEAIRATLDTSGLDLAQLSGNEPPDALAQLAGRAYKAVRFGEQCANLSRARSRFTPPNPSCPACCWIRPPHPIGGSGVRADESLAAQLARQCHLLLAGGLNPDNVTAAIQQVQPWGVDVSSRVEAAPAERSCKVRAFVQAAHAEIRGWRLEISNWR